ncbi:hypothetical protein DFP72DRAFT_777070, partial [Ephemerocybe angulata]
YLRQIYIHQPNRLYARSLIFTETLYRMLHYDRGGAIVTKYLDLHLHPETFVRLVCGLSSYDEKEVGLDTNIQWEIEYGRKTNGTISTVNANGEKVVYDIDMENPTFLRHAIRGQGTMYWHAKGPVPDTPVLIKDSWQADGRIREKVLLGRAKGIPGVIEMLGHEDNVAKTTNFRPANFASDGFVNSTLARVILRRSGPTLEKFDSEIEAIAVVRDTIQGHCNMLTGGILHRNVTIDNIMIVRGRGTLRSVIFDLDMALLAHPSERPPRCPAGRMGSRLFMPVSVIRDYEEQGMVQLAQDYLDDLEVLFYVLTKLMLGFTGIG